ncbi:MAG: hypothetical protein KHW59_07570 [Clostridiales bacterium]|nr:hypothetical protein [Clostridiales bacterium]
MNDQSGTGFLQVKVVSGNGAFGIEDALVQIFAVDDEGQDTGIIYSLRTDQSGLAPKVALPAPPKANSLTPQEDGAPSASYHVKVSKDNYNSVEITDVPVFDGVTSLQRVNLLPENEFADLSPGYPREFTQIYDVPPSELSL